MADARETLFRYLTLLQLIPRDPGRISTPVLQEKLRERGFEVDIRSLQRDLRDKLAIHFPLSCDESRKPYRWFFDRAFHCNLPALDVPSALTLVLAEQHLKNLLPPVVVAQLSAQFTDARRVLDELGANALGDWARRVRAIPEGKALKPAPVVEHIWQVVSEALLYRRALHVRYLSRSTEAEKQLMLHPQAIVSRHSMTYLLATVNKYTDIRQFALHRIHDAILSEHTRTKLDGFDVDIYIRQGGFGMRESDQEVTLKADVSPQTAWLLNETPLADSQQLDALPDSDWMRLTARIPDEQQTLWWLRALGTNVDVLAPQHWRDEILRTAQTLIDRSATRTG